MEAVPIEWIDKLFSCMSEFYGERWERLFNKPHLESMYKTIWKNGLYGLNYEQIKHALVLCKKVSVNPSSLPPHVTEFYQWARRVELPPMTYINKKDDYKCDPAIQSQAMSEIRQKLGMKRINTAILNN